jgi:hypothetical protein
MIKMTGLSGGWELRSLFVLASHKAIGIGWSVTIHSRATSAQGHSRVWDRSRLGSGLRSDISSAANPDRICAASTFYRTQRDDNGQLVS